MIFIPVSPYPDELSAGKTVAANKADVVRLQESGALLDLGRKYFGAVCQP